MRAFNISSEGGFFFIKGVLMPNQRDIRNPKMPPIIKIRANAQRKVCMGDNLSNIESFFVNLLSQHFLTFERAPIRKFLFK